MAVVSNVHGGDLKTDSLTQTQMEVFPDKTILLIIVMSLKIDKKVQTARARLHKPTTRDVAEDLTVMVATTSQDGSQCGKKLISLQYSCAKRD